MGLWSKVLAWTTLPVSTLWLIVWSLMILNIGQSITRSLFILCYKICTLPLRLMIVELLPFVYLDVPFTFLVIQCFYIYWSFVFTRVPCRSNYFFFSLSRLMVSDLILWVILWRARWYVAFDISWGLTQACI